MKKVLDNSQKLLNRISVTRANMLLNPDVFFDLQDCIAEIPDCIRTLLPYRGNPLVDVQIRELCGVLDKFLYWGLGDLLAFTTQTSRYDLEGKEFFRQFLSKALSKTKTLTYFLQTDPRNYAEYAKISAWLVCDTVKERIVHMPEPIQGEMRVILGDGRLAPRPDFEQMYGYLNLTMA
jgi:hypothetical protein